MLLEKGRDELRVGPVEPAALSLETLDGVYDATGLSILLTEATAAPTLKPVAVLTVTIES